MMGMFGGMAALESYIIKRASKSFPLLAETSVIQIPRLYGLVILNAVGSTFVMLYLGMKVGMSRKDFIEKAKKEGDEHAEERFSYPKMYAEGFDNLSKEFNCIQRGHQQALETYPQVLACSLIGGIRHPILTSIGQVVWAIARLEWAKGYAKGDPSKRYETKWGFHIWTSMLVMVTTASSTGFKVCGLF